VGQACKSENSVKAEVERMTGIASSNAKSVTSQTMNEKRGSKEEWYPCILVVGLCTLNSTPSHSHRSEKPHAVHVAVVCSSTTPLMVLRKVEFLVSINRLVLPVSAAE